jgi:hypothetical protein
MEDYVDVNFPHLGVVFVKKFGKHRRCKVRMTEKAYQCTKLVYGDGEGDLHWIERGEDYYASPHYRDKDAVQLVRKDFINSVRI